MPEKTLFRRDNSSKSLDGIVEQCTETSPKKKDDWMKRSFCVSYLSSIPLTLGYFHFIPTTLRIRNEIKEEVQREGIHSREEYSLGFKAGALLGYVTGGSATVNGYLALGVLVAPSLLLIPVATNGLSWIYESLRKISQK